MRKFFRIAAAALIALTAAGAAWGKSGKEHMKLWNDVFGITDKRSIDAIEPLWDAAQDVIDNYVSDYNELTGNRGKSTSQAVKDSAAYYIDFININGAGKNSGIPFRWFNFGNYGHRLMFHWGFNTDPRGYRPLKEQVKKCLDTLKDSLISGGVTRDDAQTFVKNQEAAFYRYLTGTIQARRNRKLINAVTNTLGIPSARGYANGIATIIYNIHLLGDYSTKKLSALPGLSAIESDMIKNGFGRIMTGNMTKRLEQIDAELKRAVNVGRGRVNQKRAELLVEATARCLPGILNERFKNTLEQKGITVADTASDAQ